MLPVATASSTSRGSSGSSVAGSETEPVPAADTAEVRPPVRLRELTDPSAAAQAPMA